MEFILPSAERAYKQNPNQYEKARQSALTNHKVIYGYDAHAGVTGWIYQMKSSLSFEWLNVSVYSGDNSKEKAFNRCEMAIECQVLTTLERQGLINASHR
jgi:hypothetical protein